jgi:fructuronate reductase
MHALTAVGVLPRLAPASLAELDGEVVLPGYDRSMVGVGIVHLGIGAFHRAHQAVFVDDLIARGHRDLGILGVSLRARDVAAQLGPQEGVYLLQTLAEAGTSLRAIAAVRAVCYAPDDPRALVAHMAAPGTRFITLTVTEKGYCHRPADGSLDFAHPDVAHDLADPDAPRSAVGFLVAMLAQRHATGLAPPTVLCCDNLPSNGRLLRGLVLEYASCVDPKLMRWIERNAAFPCTMVDRIVPATTAADRDAVARRIGLRDEGLVKAEPFSQWVIERDAAESTAIFAEVGALLVDDVTPFETMKLRLLNGSHSALAYLGYLGGCITVSDAMRLEPMRRYVARLMDREVTPTLAVPEGFDLEAYKRSLEARFANAALAHRTWQIAMDGSQKLPQRLLGTVRDRLRRDAPIAHLALAVAAWMRYVGGVDEHGAPIEVSDPLATRLRALLDAAGPDSESAVAALLDVREVFGADLRADARFRSALIEAHRALRERGALATVSALVQGEP